MHFLLDHVDAFVERKQRTLIAVDRNANHKLVDQFHCTLDDIHVPKG